MAKSESVGCRSPENKEYELKRKLNYLKKCYSCSFVSGPIEILTKPFLSPNERKRKLETKESETKSNRHIDKSCKKVLSLCFENSVDGIYSL